MIRCRPLRLLSHVIALAFTFVLTGLPAEAAPRAPSYDGNWSVIARTPDHCGTTRWMVSIVGGRVYHPSVVYVGGWPATLTGQVSRSGAITIRAVAGPRVAVGTGRMSARQGGGKWSGQGPSGTCAGVWTATRVNAPVAPYAPPVSYPWFETGPARR